MTNQRLIVVSTFIDNFGSGFSRVALIILITQWFHNPTYLGILTFSTFVPGVLLAAPLGALVDQKRRLKPLLLASNLAAALTVLMIWLVVARQIRLFPLLVLLAVIYDICSSLFDPIVVKFTVRLFDQTTYNRLNAAISTAVTSAGLFSGMLVTVLMTVMPMAALFLVDFGSYLIISVTMAGVNETYQPVAQPQADFHGQMWNGLGYVGQLLKRVPALGPILVITLLFNVLLAPNAIYLSQVATHVFANIKLTGLMDSVFSTGFLVGALLYRALDTHLALHRSIALAITLVPVAFLLFGDATNLVLSLTGLLLLGAALPFFNIAAKTILQRVIPESQLATVSNSWFSLINLSQPVGLLGIPFLISWLGIQRFCLVSGLLYLGVTAVALATHQVSAQLDEPAHVR